MAEYRQVKDAQGNPSTSMIQRAVDTAFIPFDPNNRDYVEYLAWLADGNTPDAPL
jgi:hypothetical protein